MHAVRQAACSAARAPIVLVPEIALTPQMVSLVPRALWRYRRRAAFRAFHRASSIDEWRRIRRGEARVVIGARSAVFAPVDSLGPDRDR